MTALSDWTSGYVADIGYTFGYYGELNPLRSTLALLAAGYAAPEFSACCELGFGQGVSVALHAACSDAAWHGTDFNPEQAKHARDLAEAGGVSAQLTDQAFQEFCAREDLPDFDFIGLHGIWTWISDENRSIIVDFIRRKLKLGGVVYVSYNTLPGWSASAPMRHLMTQHAEIMGARGSGILNRIDSALNFTSDVFAQNPTYLKSAPSVLERFERLKIQNKSYLAHEYFNADWHPMYFADMAEWMSPAKVSFAASATLLDAVEILNLTESQRAFMATIPDGYLRQTVRDFMVNQQFRRDYWVKGARKLSVLEQNEAYRRVRIALVVPRNSVALKVNGALGEGALSAEIYEPILEILADYKAHTLSEIEQKLVAQNIRFVQIVQAVLVLCGAGYASVAQDNAAIGRARKNTQRLNAYLMDQARGSTNIPYLASPVTATGVSVNRFQQLFAFSVTKGKKTPNEWAEFAFSILSMLDQKIIKDGRTLETDDENREELLRQAHQFGSELLPTLKGLEVI